MKPRSSPETRGLTSFGRAITTSGAALLLLGLAFGSFPYILCALFLLGAAFAARGLRAPTLTAARALSAEDVRAGEPLVVTLRVEGSDARDAAAAASAQPWRQPRLALTLHDAVPDAFLLASGRNFDAHGFLTYTLRAPRRGSYKIGPLRATAYDPLFLQSAIVRQVSDPTEVLVHPRAQAAPRIRTSAAWGRAQLPGGDKATRGILTNDFRELRPYEKGDALRSVNWKATARMSRDHLNLIVNDYEVEGKKAVWVFVDASPYTVGGTTSESTFDELAAGSLSVAGHYLDMGHRVGFTLFGSGETRVLYPDSGDLQERRIAATLASAIPGTPGAGFAKAVESTKGFLVREKPLLFVFTLAGRDPDLSAALTTARAFSTAGRRAGRIVLVTPFSDEGGGLAARMVAIRERSQLKGIERKGVTVLRYHPQKAPLLALLAKGMMR